MLRRVQKALLALILAGSATASVTWAQPAPTPAAPAQAAPAPTNIVDQWVADLNTSPNWLARYDELTVRGNTVTVSGFSVIDRLTRQGFEFETLTVSGYRALPPSGYAIESLTVDQGVGRFENVDVQITNFALSDLVVPDGTFLFVPERPFSSVIDIVAKATDISLAELRLDRLDILQDAGGLNALTSYHNYVVTGLADGRIASISAGPLVLESPWPDSLLTITVQTIESQNIDFNAIVNAFEADRYVNGIGNGQWMTLVGQTAYRNIQVDAPGLQMRIRAIEADDFSLRQADRPVEAMFETILLGTEGALQPVVPGVDFVVDALMSYSIGRLSIQGLDLFTDDLARFRLGELHITALSLDGLGEFGFSGLDIVTTDGFIAIDDFAFGDITFPKRDAMRRALVAGDRGNEVDIAELIPRIGYFELGGLELGVEGGLPITLDRARLQFGGYIGAVPTGYTFEIRGFGAPLTLIDPEIRRIFNQLGYTDLVGDFALDVAWDEANETLLLNDLYFGLVGAGSIRANLQLAGVTREMILDPNGLADLDPDQLRLAGAQVLVTDETLADRLFQRGAEGADLPPAQFRDEFIRGLPFLLQFPPISLNRDLATRLTAPLQEFLRQPGTLGVTIAPPTPIGLGELADLIQRAPNQILELLGVTITPVPPAAPN